MPSSETLSGSVEHPLKNPCFRRLWLGNMISFTGDQFYLVALPWLVLQKTGSSAALGGIMMAAATPRGLLMLVGGAVADRCSPRRVLLTTAIARAILVAAIAALSFTGWLALWQLYLLALAFGTADAFAVPASQSYLPDLVPAEQLPAANALSQASAQGITLLAPGPAGVLIGVMGSAWAFVMDAVSFLAVILALGTLPDPVRKPSDVQESMLHSITAGVRYVWRDMPLRTLMVVSAVLNFCLVGPLSVGLAWMARMQFHTALSLGVLMSCEAAGGLLGMVLAGTWKSNRRGWLMLQVCALIGLCIAWMGTLHTLLPLCMVLLLLCAAAGYLNLQLLVWFQQRVEREVRGRVMSLMMLAALGLSPFSMALAGIALHWGIPLLFAVSGGLVLLTCAWAATLAGVRAIE